MSRVNVIGDGIVGLCSAHSLLVRGHSVRLFGVPHLAGAASWGCAGHIATEQIEPLASWATIRAMPRMLHPFGGPVSFPLTQVASWLPFSLRFLQAARRSRFEAGRAALTALLGRSMESWAARLGHLSAADLLSRKGHLVCWDSPAEARAGIARWRAKVPPFIQIADPVPADRPMLGRLGVPQDQAARFEGSGQITDLAALSRRLRAAVTELGGELIERHNGLSRLDPLAGETILITAGWRSGELLAQAGARAPVISERGYHVEIDATSDLPETVPIAFESKAMIMTRFAASLRFASFVEFGDGHAGPDPGKWRRLETRMAELGFDPAGARQWHGSRPTLPDYLPAIGRLTGSTKIFYAFGHQHLGLTLGSITGDLIAGLIAKETAPLDLEPFSLRRFGRDAG